MKLSLILMTLSLVVTACSTTSGPGFGTGTGATAAAVLGTGTLDEAATKHVAYMREEEKLARDVYAHFSQRWGDPTFARIQQSEERHVAAIGRVVVAYGLVDPLADDQPGHFVDADLQALYDQLVATGDASLEAALGVGALIEEVDIRDLRLAIAESPADVVSVYERLAFASGNHLKAFTSALAARGVTYAPQVLAEADYQQTLAAAPGCGAGGQGRGQGRGAGMGQGRCAMDGTGQCPNGGRGRRGRGN